MNTHDQIIKQKQQIARCEKSLVMEKLTKRRADTRRKIELGGLVIKSGIHGHSKAVILGALLQAMKLIKDDKQHVSIFESIGSNAFLREF